jgi:hypothetical protein
MLRGTVASGFFKRVCSYRDCRVTGGALSWHCNKLDKASARCCGNVVTFATQLGTMHQPVYSWQIRFYFAIYSF